MSTTMMQNFGPMDPNICIVMVMGPDRAQPGPITATVRPFAAYDKRPATSPTMRSNWPNPEALGPTAGSSRTRPGSSRTRPGSRELPDKARQLSGQQPEALGPTAGSSRTRPGSSRTRSPCRARELTGRAPQIGLIRALLEPS
jgi:hypothetical protein